MRSLFAAILAAGAIGATAIEPVPFEVELTVAHQEFDGSFCWFHPRPAAYPGPDGTRAIITMQQWMLTASDYFSGLSVLKSPDMGETWEGPTAVPQMAWRDLGGGITVGMCDVTPGWHEPTGKILAVGHTVHYKDGKLAPDPRPRQTAYAVYDPETNTWTDWREVAMPDGAKFFNVGNGCGQRLTEADGSLLIPVYFKGETGSVYTSTVMRCHFDGTTLSYVENGSEHTLTEDPKRGLYEPSLTFYGGKYYLTLRNDDRAYMAISDDGLHFDTPTPWTFDDGAELGSYNTQAHWIAHSSGLFLVYTRRGANNDHVVRNRAPLFMAQVDPANHSVLRATEVVLVPERGAMLGNFGAAAISENESWVTVGEGMHGDAAKRGANGSVFVAKIKWGAKNKLAERLR